MAITSPSKGILEVNDEICKILGYERSGLLQMSWGELTHPDDLASDLHKFNQVLAGVINGYTIDKRFYTPRWRHNLRDDFGEGRSRLDRLGRLSCSALTRRYRTETGGSEDRGSTASARANRGTFAPHAAFLGGCRLDWDIASNVVERTRIAPFNSAFRSVSSRKRSRGLQRSCTRKTGSVSSKRSPLRSNTARNTTRNSASCGRRRRPVLGRPRKGLSRRGWATASAHRRHLGRDGTPAGGGEPARRRQEARGGRRNSASCWKRRQTPWWW